MASSSTPDNGSMRPSPAGGRVGLVHRGREGAEVPSLELLSSPQVAALLGVKNQTLRKWRCSGRGPRYVRLGGRAARVAYRPGEVEQWLRDNTFASTSAETVADGRDRGRS